MNLASCNFYEEAPKSFSQLSSEAMKEIRLAATCSQLVVSSSGISSCILHLHIAP